MAARTGTERAACRSSAPGASAAQQPRDGSRHRDFHHHLQHFARLAVGKPRRVHVFREEDREVSGAKVQRVGAGGRFQPSELGKPIRGMNDPVPAGMRNPREEMIRIALTYPEGLRVGNFTDGGTPFAEGAYRVENGVITADQTDPRRRMYEQNIIVHPGIISSVAAVDEENGTVLLWMNFGHTGDSYGVGNALVTFEAFKVWGGKIQSVNAFFKGLPISTARFWPSSDPVRR